MLDQVDTLIAFSLVMLLLSLLMTVLVQLVQTAVQRRGRNLRWGVILLFRQLGLPRKRARKLADEVLTHPAISPDGVSLAEAISADELLRLVEEIAGRADDESKIEAEYGRIQAKWLALLDMLEGIVERLFLKVGNDDPDDQAAANEVRDAGRVLLDNLLAKVPEEASTIEERATESIAEAVNQAVVRRDQLVGWFDMIMARTTERFVSHARLITVVLSFLMCFGLRIDAISILSELSTNSEVRAALVSKSEDALERYEDRLLLAEKTRGAVRDAFGATLEELSAPEAGAAEEELIGYLRERARNTDAPLRTDRDVEAWIDRALSSRRAVEILPSEDAREMLRKNLLPRFRSDLEAKHEELEGELKTAVQEIRGDIAELELDLFRSFRDGKFVYFDGWSWTHVLGILIAAMLVSLGAPFWFNTLRNLSNLRPTLAKKADAAADQASDQDAVRDQAKT